jgi:transcriptional regulator with XRE-family HTH domain
MTLIDEIRARRRLPPPEKRREIRRAAGVSAARVAAEVKVHRSTVIRWESGEQEPRGSALERYADLLRELRDLEQAQ